MIDPKRSKFDFGAFRDGYDEFAVNRGKYTKEEAIALYCQEMGVEPGMIVAISEAFVSHHAGITEDGEPVVGWWLEYRERKSSCPVWVMHLDFSRSATTWRQYEFVEIKEQEAKSEA